MYWAVRAGNDTAIGALLLGSATLALHPVPGIANMSTAQIVANAVSAANMSPQA